jgi:MFS transporter, ACS family, allantoate permease
VAYGIAHGDKVHGFTVAPWKIIYLFTGLLTIVLGIIFLILMPDNQLNAWWLSPEDRVLAVERVRQNQQGIGNKHFKLYQLKEAFVDPMVWSFCVIAVAGNIPNGGLSNFFNLLIESFGYSAEESLLYGCITGAVQIAILVGWAYLVLAFGNRILWGIGAMFIGLLGAVLLVVLPESNGRGRLAGFYLCQCFMLAVVLIVSMIVTNVAG